jgi:hypothetical protein
MADQDPFADMLPEGAISLGFAGSIKALDAKGDVVLYHVRSDDLAAWEALGALVSAVDDIRDYLRSLGRDGGDDD